MTDEREDAPQDDEARPGGVPFSESGGLRSPMGLEDVAEVALNAADADAETTARLQGAEHVPTAPLPSRPAASASKGEWVEYVEALGADRRFLDGESEHWTGAGYAAATGLTVEELQALASWLGG
jgi:hypothetical protein